MLIKQKEYNARKKVGETSLNKKQEIGLVENKENKPALAEYVFILISPERPINGIISWETIMTINGKDHFVKCENGKITTDQEDVKDEMIKNGWLLNEKITKEEFENGKSKEYKDYYSDRA